ncbi:hypothetical protein Bca52824_032777 [Brassica carinata]|uniref:Ubiquitin-like protease family profile domain-containing protein n=1 Tax=Brassica carinata TaxID=52824 RepID=A0A8X7V7V4_BRACI|nr:hypothetical protein Bca52824_032777 [Brassica carinata]
MKQSSTTMKQLTMNAYSIVRVPMKRRLNKTCCDYGAYAIKFMECHLLGLDISLADDQNIFGCRHKIGLIFGRLRMIQSWWIGCQGRSHLKSILLIMLI